MQSRGSRGMQSRGSRGEQGLFALSLKREAVWSVYNVESRIKLTKKCNDFLAERFEN